ncbi:MAG: hypothetical protein ABJA78_13595 [Ferruginibacter sp.]
MKKISIPFALILAATQLQAQTVTQGQSLQQTFKAYTQTAFNDVTGSTGSRMSTLTINESTQGSAYLFGNWTSGKVTLNDGTVYLQSDSSLNFNKEKQQLTLKLSPIQGFDINSNSIRSFELSQNGHPYKFVYFQSKSSDCFIEIFLDSSYGVYKTVHTKFYKADYENKGLYETGHKYDRYEDEVNYYIRTHAGNLIAINNVSKKKLKSLSSELPGIEEAVKNTTASPEEDKDIFLTEVFTKLNHKK